ncbi:hypothetical protein MXEN_15677 [Mycobacterium xenopi RIVM700367]|nr:hypothetical protein MXEN_15677 [Mycobacterium xenopi RIVM700367]
MVIADGPNQAPLVRLETTDEYETAVDWSSAESLSQAAAAARIDPEPGPLYILPELISGGSAA